MRKIILYLLPFLFCLSCVDKKESVQPISLSIKNIYMDSVGIRVIHYMDGKELFDTIIASKDTFMMGNLKEDMYLLAIYWPRTFVPHQIYKDRSFNKEVGEYYNLTKAFYVEPKSSLVYEFYTDSLYTGEEIELNNITKVNVNVSQCQTCAVADEFWDNYTKFFDRKEVLVDELNLSFYRSIENKNKELSRTNFIKADSVKKSLLTDSLYKIDFDNLVQLHPESKASTFFVFYQLYLERDFEKYRNSFDILKGQALESKYYQMIKKQYDN
ncbi:hypothetical protein [Sphingobacterium hungaricum]|uniref:DUF4369 domain-containing protein n=1 Tax=Sphingobacterium hungaricum TaxID=2082723 RepID=A0A928UX54_9SPHI|nr:hypothetical protein [Sphingobacterium hungaricum]MBE8714322.1 hypothetical protein [Sphingobacterium hungaricum]